MTNLDELVTITMCVCTPSKRIPYCGKPGCEAPKKPDLYKRRPFRSHGIDGRLPQEKKDDKP
jgi:hypothetical protein